MPNTAYYDREVDIAWIPTGSSQSSKRVASAEQTWGLIDHHLNGTIAGIEIWDASTRIPSTVLQALPEPQAPWDGASAAPVDKCLQLNTDVHVGLRKLTSAHVLRYGSSCG